jgi:hypothetical protein
MTANLTRSASKWFNVYADYLDNWWSHITYSQYMVLMVLGLLFGWILLKSSVKSV